ncbi:neither inactivation nor afterpotential protein C isoform X2 [Pieris rapae]|uniref:neither inactivation nor afterpotential protein C isoform X2 n=1 Tax=Pieris rapae TaxID=64459 RepID=UPI001E281A8C|nr:neither inactivation nor afterpotential protein C isoform X2 [Pieris rapae]
MYEIRTRDGLNVSSLSSPHDRYKIEKKLGSGIFGKVFQASDDQAAGKSVAVKVINLTDTKEQHIHEECKILRDFTKHPNIIDFYGVFCERSEYVKKIWFVIELCEFGSVIDIVRKLNAMDKKMSEEHIAYILKYTIKALVYLHENKVMHRNVRASNILIKNNGEIKICDFSLCCQLKDALDKTTSYIGSPSWMAPEMVTRGEEGYDNRVDVWALGITTIEMVDGKGPFEDMHPTGALFQIVRNPPPGVLKPAMSSNEINDFINECLEKNPEHRPFIMELEEHPFIQSVPENDFHLSTEIKMLANDLQEKETPPRKPERIIKDGLLITQGRHEPETMQVEDLAALECLTEENILSEIHTKLEKGSFMSFIGDILLILNPNSSDDIYNEEYHKKYECKSRSDNEPHIFSVADSAYQNALHHNEQQYIVFSGESKSGKTTSVLHALSHLTYLGAMKNNTGERIQNATTIILACISAATPIHSNSTRGIFHIQVTYGSSGKLSGAIFWLYQLEKWRVSSTDMSHANFNIMYYFYDSKEADNKLSELHLERNRKHRYLRILDDSIRGIQGARENPRDNAKRYKDIIEYLKLLDWQEDEITFFETVLAAILVLGNVRFRDGKSGSAEIENPDEAKKVAKLLSLDEVKFMWALLNYCLIENGNAVKRKHSTDEARDARDTLASTLYKRLVDWMINLINSKLSFMRQVFGDKYSVSLIDVFGFECYHRNRLEQLIVNTTNEQLQFLYNQKIFAWEMQEEEEEEVPVLPLHYYDNKNSVDQLLAKPHGIFYILDEASRTGGGQDFIMSTVRASCKGPYVKLAGSHEFSVAHYTGKVNYDTREMADKNKDFLPPEMTETMRASTNLTMQQLFKNRLTKTGNLTLAPNENESSANRTKSQKEQENIKARKFNTVSKGQYSQVRRMRTAAATYRVTSLEILKQLSTSNGLHFVRCVRTDLNDNPRGFQTEVVKQQLRAMAVLDTAKARQCGFSYRIPFAEFIKRYRFLAFDFDENVDETKDNCRLLMIRLKMEGWELGKSKAFLKYYNEEFLSRLYETQVKKIVKVQSMMRTFLAKRKAVQSKSKAMHIKELKKQKSANMNDEEAALVIQKAYRGFVVRKAYGPIVNKTTGEIDEETSSFLKRFARKWKSRSLFQVLLQYRALRYQDLVNFSQQIHIYNQVLVEGLLNTNSSVLLERIDPHARKEFLGTPRPTVWKLPFRLDEIQYFDTSHMCDPKVKSNSSGSTTRTKSTQTLLSVPFCRDPTQPMPKLPDEPKTEYVPNRPVLYNKKHVSSPQKFYQPPTPWATNNEDTFENTVPRRSTSFYGPDSEACDPIRELQALAKSTGDLNTDDDNPPFNFQAMLKKTPKNRASMKRYGENDGSFERTQAPPKRIITPTEQTNAYRGPRRSESGNMISAPTTPTSPSGRYNYDDPVSRSDDYLKPKNNFIDNRDETKTVEIAPGISVEGTVTDL